MLQENNKGLLNNKSVKPHSNNLNIKQRRRAAYTNLYFTLNKRTQTHNNNQPHPINNTLLPNHNHNNKTNINNSNTVVMCLCGSMVVGRFGLRAHFQIGINCRCNKSRILSSSWGWRARINWRLASTSTGSISMANVNCHKIYPRYKRMDKLITVLKSDNHKLLWYHPNNNKFSSKFKLLITHLLIQDKIQVLLTRLGSKIQLKPAATRQQQTLQDVNNHHHPSNSNSSSNSEMMKILRVSIVRRCRMRRLWTLRRRLCRCICSTIFWRGSKYRCIMRRIVGIWKPTWLSLSRKTRYKSHHTSY